MGARRTCNSFKYVNVKGQGRARRCADFTVHRGRYAKKRRGRKSKRRYASKRRRPFNKGKSCLQFGMHFSKRARRDVRYCASYGASPDWRKKSGRKRGGKRSYEERYGDDWGRGEAASWQQPSMYDRLKNALFTRREAEFSGLGRYRR